MCGTYVHMRSSEEGIAPKRKRHKLVGWSTQESISEEGKDTIREQVHKSYNGRSPDEVPA